MPIEIKELVIRTQVSAPEAAPRQEGEADPGGRSAAPASLPDTEVLVQECIRQVLQILARQRER